MDRTPPDRELGEFLSELHQVRAQGDRAVAASYIRAYRGPLERYIEDKRRRGELDLATYYDGLVTDYEAGPDGAWFDRDIGALRSFSLARDNAATFRLVTGRRWYQWVGYGLVGLVLACLLFLAWQVRRTAEDFFLLQAEAYTAELGDIP